MEEGVSSTCTDIIEDSFYICNYYHQIYLQIFSLGETSFEKITIGILLYWKQIEQLFSKSIYSLTCAHAKDNIDAFNLQLVLLFKETTSPCHTQKSANIVIMDCNTKSL